MQKGDDGMLLRALEHLESRLLDPSVTDVEKELIRATLWPHIFNRQETNDER